MTLPLAVPNLAGKRILIVEDEALIAFVMVDDLENVGAVPVGPCARVAEALKEIRNGMPLDGALLNVRLHGELSFSVAEELALRDVPFVFVTGNDPTVTKQHPGVPVFSKPADMVTVFSTLAMLVAQRAAAGS